MENQENHKDAKINKPNILVIGPSGAGKSMLINELFRKEIAGVGTGKPCTDNFDYYDSNPYINIYDSKGLERDTNIDEFIDEISEFIDKINESIDAKKHTRIALYCIGEPRLQKSDIKLINAIKNKKVMPILVFTKSDTRSEKEIAALKKAAEEYRLITDDVIFTAAEKANPKLYEMTPDDIKNGTQKLMERILYNAPEMEKISVIMALRNKENKKQAIESLKYQAKNIVKQTVSSSQTDINLNHICIMDMAEKLARYYFEYSYKTEVLDETREFILSNNSKFDFETFKNCIIKGFGDLFIDKFEKKAIDIIDGSTSKNLNLKFKELETRIKKYQAEVIKSGEDMIPLLKLCNNDELDPLVEYIKKKFSEFLTINELYKTHYPDHKMYIDVIADEIRKFGGNTIANTVRGKGVQYEEIVRDVAKKLDVPVEDNQGIFETEINIILKSFEKSLEEMDETGKKTVLEDLGINNCYDFEDISGFIRREINNGNYSEIHDISIIVASGMAMKLLGEAANDAAFSTGITIAGGLGTAALARLVTAFAGPVTIAITTILSVLSISGPAYSVMIPCVLHIAMLRLKYICFLMNK